MNTRAVDRFNLALLIMSFSVAYLIPFELLLLSYAFIGPLHYLTEISWLHDRKYFTLLPEDPIYLTVGSLVMLFFGAAIFPSSSELIWILLLVAFCAAFVRSLWKRFFIILTGILFIIPWLGSVSSYATSVLIPTVVHVYVFTIVFMIYGALKGNSILGYFNSMLFFVGGLALLILPQSGMSIMPSYVSEHYDFFGGIARVVGDVFAVSPTTVIRHNKNICSAAL